MMLLCYHGMVPLQHLCDIGAVTVRLCVQPILNSLGTYKAMNRSYTE